MEDHTYFVGECGVLVHNHCNNPKAKKITNAKEKISEKITDNIRSGSTELVEYDPEFAARQLLDGGTVSEKSLRNIIPRDTPNTFIPSDSIAEGYKYSFNINGTRMEIKWHSPDLNALAKYSECNSGNGWTAQIKVGKKLMTQGGRFVKNPTNYTHIPMK